MDAFNYNRSGQVFFAANNTEVTLSALSATATGLILCNPWGSGKNIALLSVQWAHTTAPAGAAVVGIAASPQVPTAPTHTTPAVIYSGLLTGVAAANSVARVDTSATTIGTPIMIRQLGGPVAASSISPPYINDRIDGEIILLPGVSIQLAYLTTAALGRGSIYWLEYTP